MVGVSYSTLPSSPELHESETAAESSEFSKPNRNLSIAFGESRLQKWALFGALCASAMSLMLFLQESFYPPNAPCDISSPVEKEIRRPSTYMNLEKVSKNMSRSALQSIASFPQIVLQIEPQDPLRTLHEDERGYYSREGGMYPDDRHFKMSSTISTVVQFYNLDFGMENCQLSIRMPEPGKQSQSEELSSVDVWFLDSSREISRYTSWLYAPPRTKYLSSFSLSTNSSIISERFYCPSGNFTTFEFTCLSEQSHCDVDFWQKKNKALEGIILLQHDSVFNQ